MSALFALCKRMLRVWANHKSRETVGSAHSVWAKCSVDSFRSIFIYSSLKDHKSSIAHTSGRFGHYDINAAFGDTDSYLRTEKCRGANK